LEETSIISLSSYMQEVSTKKKIMVLGAIVLLGSGIFFAYYVLSPLWNPLILNEASPSSSTEGTNFENTSDTTNATVRKGVAIVDTPQHPATGKVRVVTGNGKTYIRYEDYKTINGPDLYVYLSKDLDAKEFVDLGAVRATEGSVNYELPSGINVSDYRYVLTWCKQFNVLFNSADIGGT